MEKADKPRRILQAEFQFLKKLSGLPGIVPVYEFVDQEQLNKQNFIVMELKGQNLATFKKNQNKNFQLPLRINILIQMLNAIEEVHKAGIIHRDIKPSNFVMGKTNSDRLNVFLVDFGLAKDHLNLNTGKPHQARRHTDFRGTIPYASLSAHEKKELGRKDDLWSFFFVVMEFFDEPLPWKTNTNKDEVKVLKTKAFKRPGKCLLPNLHKKHPEIFEMFKYLNKLKYQDEPDYDFTRSFLINIQKQVTSNGYAQSHENQRELIMQNSLNHIKQMQQLQQQQQMMPSPLSSQQNSQNPQSQIQSQQPNQQMVFFYQPPNGGQAPMTSNVPMSLPSSQGQSSVPSSFQPHNQNVNNSSNLAHMQQLTAFFQHQNFMMAAASYGQGGGLQQNNQGIQPQQQNNPALQQIFRPNQQNQNFRPTPCAQQQNPPQQIQPPTTGLPQTIMQPTLQSLIPIQPATTSNFQMIPQQTSQSQGQRRSTSVQPVQQFPIQSNNQPGIQNDNENESPAVIIQQQPQPYYKINLAPPSSSPVSTTSPTPQNKVQAEQKSAPQQKNTKKRSHKATVKIQQKQSTLQAESQHFSYGQFTPPEQKNNPADMKELVAFGEVASQEIGEVITNGQMLEAVDAQDDDIDTQYSEVFAIERARTKKEKRKKKGNQSQECNETNSLDEQFQQFVGGRNSSEGKHQQNNQSGYTGTETPQSPLEAFSPNQGLGLMGVGSPMTTNGNGMLQASMCTIETSKRKRGRPKGSKNKYRTGVTPLKDSTASAASCSAPIIQCPVLRKRPKPNEETSNVQPNSTGLVKPTSGVLNLFPRSTSNLL